MRRKAILSILLPGILLVSCVAPAPATTPAPAAVARTASFVTVEDDVRARETATADFAAAQAGMVLLVGGQVRTGEPGRARLDLAPDGTIVRVGPTSEFTLAELNDDIQTPLTRLKLAAGQLWIILNGGELNVETEVGIASVRGSFMGVTFEPVTQFMTATCLEGTCSLANDLGATDLTGGQASDIPGPGMPPSPARDMTGAEYRDWLENNPEAASLPIVTPTPLSGQLVIPVSEDTMADSVRPDSVLGSDPSFYIYGAVANVYLRFPLTGLPAGAEIVSAILNMSINPYSHAEGTSAQLQVSALNLPWSESSLTWNNQPGPDPNSPMVDCIMNAYASDAQDICDVTELMLFAKKNNASALDLLMTGKQIKDSQEWYSREASGYDAPTLIVDYLVP